MALEATAKRISSKQSSGNGDRRKSEVQVYSELEDIMRNFDVEKHGRQSIRKASLPKVAVRPEDEAKEDRRKLSKEYLLMFYPDEVPDSPANKSVKTVRRMQRSEMETSSSEPTLRLPQKRATLPDRLPDHADPVQFSQGGATSSNGNLVRRATIGNGQRKLNKAEPESFTKILEESKKYSAQLRHPNDREGAAMVRRCVEAPIKKGISVERAPLATGDVMCGFSIGDHVMVDGRVGLGGNIGIVTGAGSAYGCLSVTFKQEGGKDKVYMDLQAQRLTKLTQEQLGKLEEEVKYPGTTNGRRTMADTVTSRIPTRRATLQ